MGIREKNHRLPGEFYRGEVSVAFTLCLKNGVQGFMNPDIVNIFIDILSSVVTAAGCIVPVYCFMPDHQHLIITGTSRDSDILKTIIKYKQKTGFWMSKNNSSMEWQKDFYDHVIRTYKNVAVQTRYILDNPVRKGLVFSWEEYPFKSSIGCRIEDVLDGIICAG